MRNGGDETSSDEDSGSSASDSTTDSAAIGSDEEASSSSPEPSSTCLDGAKCGEASNDTPQLDQAAKAEFRARNILALKNDRSGVVPRFWPPDAVMQLASRSADADAGAHATLRSLNVSRKPLAQVLTVQGQESVLGAFKSPVPGASGPSQARSHA